MAKVLIQGASRGLGFQFSESLIDKGMAIIACCRNPHNAKDLNALKEKHPAMLDIVKMDVTEENSIKDVAHHVQLKHGGKLDLLINCSGILHPSGSGETNLRQITLQGLQATINVNTFGPLLMAKYFSPFLQSGAGLVGARTEEKGRRHCGVLVNISARVGSITDNRLGGWYSYRLSKAALNMATKTVSIELGRGSKKIICVALHPGTVDTDLSRPYHRNVPKGKLFSPQVSVSHLLSIINRLSIEDTGKFFDWEGKEIPF